MAERKKDAELDKLSLEMIECEKAGYGVHYGKWKAAQKVVVPEQKGIPDGWRVCARCGKPFKPKTKRIQYYCEANCQVEAQREKDRQRHAKYIREYREKQARKEESNENESCG